MKKFIYTIALVLSASALFVACGKKGGSSSTACTPTYNYNTYGYSNYNTTGCNGTYPNNYGTVCPANYVMSSANVCCPQGAVGQPGQNGCIAAQGTGAYPFGQGGYQGYVPGGYYTQPYYPYYPQNYGYGPSYGFNFYIGW